MRLRVSSVALSLVVASITAACTGATSGHRVARTTPPSPMAIRAATATQPPPPAVPPAVAGAEASAQAAALPPGAPFDLRAISFPTPSDGWVGGVGVILATQDGGRTWLRQYRGPDSISQLDFVDRLDGWAVGGLSLYHTTDGGRQWTPVGEPPAKALQQLHFVTASFGWGIGGGVLLTTHNGGLGWMAVRTPIPVGEACFLDANKGWIVNGPGPSDAETPAALLATTDGGRSWQLAPLALDLSYLPSFRHELRCAAPDVLWDLINFGPYAGGEGYLLSRSDDGGLHWNALLQNQAPLSESQHASVPVEGPGSIPRSLVLVGTRGAEFSGTCPSCGGPLGETGIGATVDGGRTWQLSPVPGAPGLSSDAIAFPDATHGWLVASWLALGSRQRQSAIFATCDGGKTWIQQYPPTP